MWPPQVGRRPADLHQRYSELGHRVVARSLIEVRPDRSRHLLARRLLAVSRFVGPTTRHHPRYLSQTHHFVQIPRLVGFVLLLLVVLGPDPLVGRAVIEQSRGWQWHLLHWAAEINSFRRR